MLSSLNNYLSDIKDIKKDYTIKSEMGKLLTEYDDCKLLNYQDSNGLTAVHVAILNKQWDILERLLNLNVNLKKKDKSGIVVVLSDRF